jgi:hypothetical protein
MHGRLKVMADLPQRTPCGDQPSVKKRRLRTNEAVQSAKPTAI